jgi:hypothetical protein
VREGTSAVRPIGRAHRLFVDGDGTVVRGFETDHLLDSTGAALRDISLTGNSTITEMAEILDRVGAFGGFALVRPEPTEASTIAGSLASPERLAAVQAAIDARPTTDIPQQLLVAWAIRDEMVHNWILAGYGTEAEAEPAVDQWATHLITGELFTRPGEMWVDYFPDLTVERQGLVVVAHTSWAAEGDERADVLLRLLDSAEMLFTFAS